MSSPKSIDTSTLVAFALIVGMTFCLRGRSSTTASDLLRFEVASVKATPRVRLLRSLMTVAYGVTDRQISGGARWMEKERFDIEAKADRPRTIDELHTMLAHLLEERFHL